MIQTVITCDRCQTEIRTNRRASVLVEIYGLANDDRRHVDLCVPCEHALLQFLKLS